MVVWGGGLKFQDFTREQVTAGPDGTTEVQILDIHDGSKYVAPMFLYMFYGAFDAIYQNYILWLLGALSNNPKKVALYAGFYKGIQSAGAAIIWRLDALHKPYMVMFASSWGLSAGSMLFALPLIFWKVKDTTDAEEDDIADIMDSEEIEPQAVEPAAI